MSVVFSFRVFVHFLIVVCILSTTAANAGSDAVRNEVIIHSMGGWSPEIQSYQEDILRTVLMLSRDAYGPYQLNVDKRKLSGVRWAIQIRRGEIHTSFSSSKFYNESAESSDVKWFPYPFMKSLLGLRRLLVRREDLEKFSGVKSLSDLKKFRVGQGSAWPDTKVYENAGFQIVKGQSLDELLPMLIKKRFDFLPLSVLEAEGTLNGRSDLLENLTLLDGVYVFYPISVYLVVTKSNSDLVRRINYGLNKLFDEAHNPVFNAIFERYYLEVERQLGKEMNVIIELQNPLISRKENNSIRNYFYRNYCVIPKACLVER